MAARQAVSLLLLWANIIPVNTSEEEIRQAPGSLGNHDFPGTGISLKSALRMLEKSYTENQFI